jgi:hypothetical protein
VVLGVESSSIVTAITAVRSEHGDAVPWNVIAFGLFMGLF